MLARARMPCKKAIPESALLRQAGGRPMVAPTSPLKLKLHLFRQVCRGRIYASRAVSPLYRIIGTAAAGGIYAAPTRQPILFILVYGRGRGVPRPYIPYMTKQVLFPPLLCPCTFLKWGLRFFLFFQEILSQYPFLSPALPQTSYKKKTRKSIASPFL